MGTVTVYPGGSTAGFPSDSKHRRAKRGRVTGWTPAAARRLLTFLWSVESERLDGDGLAVTLTMGGRPADALEWAHARGLLLQWLRDHGATRWQWLTEWTAQGRPHLHLAVYGDGIGAELVALAWIRISRSAGWPASWKGQSVEPIFDAEGWLKYVAKHSARGVDHYQRETPPPGWETTGRLWGKGGDWPTVEPQKLYLTGPQTFLYMAHFKEWQAARMILEGVSQEQVDKYLADGVGEIRGLSGWIPYAESVRLLLISTEYPESGHTERETRNVSSIEGHRPGNHSRRERARGNIAHQRGSLATT